VGFDVTELIQHLDALPDDDQVTNNTFEDYRANILYQSETTPFLQLPTPTSNDLEEAAEYDEMHDSDPYFTSDLSEDVALCRSLTESFNIGQTTVAARPANDPCAAAPITPSAEWKLLRNQLIQTFTNADDENYRLTSTNCEVTASNLSGVVTLLFQPHAPINQPSELLNLNPWGPVTFDQYHDKGREIVLSLATVRITASCRVSRRTLTSQC
jgi:hypothetical protein